MYIRFIIFNDREHFITCQKVNFYNIISKKIYIVHIYNIYDLFYYFNSWNLNLYLHTKSFK